MPGTIACDSTDVFQEGLRLPWMKLYEDGEPVEAIFKIIRANVRMPHELLGDLNAQVAACTIGERGLQDLARATAPSGSRTLMDGLLDHTERLLRREIASWPDGTATFTDYMDSDGIDVCDVPIDRAPDDPRRRADRRLLRLGADGARRAELHAVVRRGERLPRP